MKLVSYYKIAVFPVLFFLFGQNVFAQGYDYEANEHSLSLGVGFGYMFSDAAASPSNYSSLFRDFAGQDLDYLLTVEYRRYVMAGLSWVLNFGASRCQGNRDFERHLRDYSYMSYIGKVSALGNFEFFSFFSQRKIPLDVYLIGGVGLIGASVSRQEFDPTSGRPDAGDKLSKTGGGLMLVGGLGFRFPLSDVVDCRIEGKYNFTTTDYLDGYSPAASRHNDLLVEAEIKISYHLWIKECHCR